MLEIVFESNRGIYSKVEANSIGSNIAVFGMSKFEGK